MRHFAPSEAKRNLYLVALFEELLDSAHLDFVIMGIDIRPQLNFLDFDSLLFLSRFSSFLLCLELILPEIHDLTDRDFSIYRNLDKIETGFLSLRKRVALIDGAVVLPMLVDELNFTGDNSFVNARTFFGGRAANRTAYVTSPMAVDGAS